MDLTPALHGYPIDPSVRRRTATSAAARRRPAGGSGRLAWLRPRWGRRRPR